MKRYGIAATAGIATLALSAGTALADTSTPTSLGKAARWDHVDSSVLELVRDLPPPTRTPKLFETIPNQFAPQPARAQDDPLFVDPLVDNTNNPVLSPMVATSFDTYSNDDNAAANGFLVAPPDTNGDVGRNNVVTYVNLGYSVYDKAGNLLAGPIPGNAFWAGFGGACQANNNGDPIVIYDAEAGRWVYTQFAPFQGVQCFAISDGEDPLVGLTRYEFVVEPAAFNDYPKVNVWHNADGSQSAYTYTGRNFIPQGSPAFGRDITAVLFDRDAMLAGGPAGFTTAVMPGGFVTYDGPQPGAIQAGSTAPAGACPLFSVAEAPRTYRFYEFCENFPAAGTFTTKPTVTVAQFDDNLGNIPQPAGGSSLDNLAFFTMYRSNHAVIDGEHRLAMAHTVDAGGDRAGMRWTILDVDNYNAITIIDQGTHAPNDGFERWMGSVALDSVGNLGLGYTRGGNNQPTDVYVTGRETTDPAGTVQAEVECVDGTGVQQGVSRWGDYSATVLDPVDGCTFWTFQEYVKTSGNFQWNTRACSFSFDSCTGVTPTDYTLLPADPGVAGGVNDFTTENGTPNRAQALYFGFTRGSTPVTLGGCSTTIELDGARLLGFSADPDGDGSVTISRNIPGQVAGRTVRFQALDISGCEISNVTTETF